MTSYYKSVSNPMKDLNIPKNEITENKNLSNSGRFSSSFSFLSFYDEKLNHQLVNQWKRLNYFQNTKFSVLNAKQRLRIVEKHRLERLSVHALVVGLIS